MMFMMCDDGQTNVNLDELGTHFGDCAELVRPMTCATSEQNETLQTSLICFNIFFLFLFYFIFAMQSLTA